MDSHPLEDLAYLLIYPCIPWVAVQSQAQTLFLVQDL